MIRHGIRGTIGMALVAAGLVFGLWSCGGGGDETPAAGSGGGAGTPKAAAQNYTAAMEDASSDVQGFVQNVQQWEGADFSTLSVSQIKALAASYLASGEAFVESLNSLNSAAGSIAKLSGDGTAVLYLGGVMDEVIDAAPDAGNGVSPGLVKGVGDVIGETKDAVKILNEKWEKGEIDDNTYKTEMDKLRKQKTLKAAGLGVSAVVGTAGAAVVGAGLTLASAPAAVVVGGTVLAGYAVGKTVSWLWNKCAGISSGSSLMAESAQVCKLSSGQTAAGASIPNMMEEGGTLIISIPGYVPVVITNFKPPAAGHKLTIDFKPIPIDEFNAGDKITVSYNDIVAAATSCADIVAVTGTPSPLDPGPGQGVTVTATLVPPVQGCTIDFSIVGTDGYTKSQTSTSDASGKATFYIPGGAEDVHDTVTIRAGGKEYVVTYTF